MNHYELFDLLRVGSIHSKDSLAEGMACDDDRIHT